MSDKLRWSESKELVESLKWELSNGEQANTYHCKSGKSNDKLYIKRSEDGKFYLLYCHHCGASGYYKPTSEYRINSATSTKGPSGSHGGASDYRNYNLPTDVQGDTTEWPREARAWVFRYGITEDELRDRGIVYSPRLRRVLIPITIDGGYSGYQARKIYESDPKPKYITRRKPGVKALYQVLLGTDTERVVIVEDLLSGIKVNRLGITCIVLLGTNIYSNIYIYISSFKKIYIYLDNDNIQVIKQRNKIRKELSLFATRVKVVTEKRDPKTLSRKELEEILK